MRADHAQRIFNLSCSAERAVVSLRVEMGGPCSLAKDLMRLSLLGGWMLLAAGCFMRAGYLVYSTPEETAVGEEHDVNFSAQDAFVLTQDALRGEGVLFTSRPDQSLVTNWKDADDGPGIFGDLVGLRPRYRYEIRTVALGARWSRIIVNIRAEAMPTSKLASYKASQRLGLFNKIDQLAQTFPPPTNVPSQGGVNFALLPNEDLRALAKRVTGNEDNWKQIAKDNGLGSPTDVAGVQSVWIRDSLLERADSSGVSRRPTP